MALDKTRTLTEGKSRVQKAVVLDESMDEKQQLRLAAAADRRSAHSFAKAVIDYVTTAGIEYPQPETFEAIQGRGVRATVESKRVFVGNAALLKNHQIERPFAKGEAGMTTVYIAVEGRTVNLLQIADQLRPGGTRGYRQTESQRREAHCDANR